MDRLYRCRELVPRLLSDHKRMREVVTEVAKQKCRHFTLERAESKIVETYCGRCVTCQARALIGEVKDE
jgi:hypothetical protein